MRTVHDILFRPFRLDIENEILWRGSRILALRQKSFALLRHLAEHPGELVSKEELLKAVWPETRVSDIVLKVCIREVRQVLGDQPQAPAYIETVQRRGYRFIRPVRNQALTNGRQPKKNFTKAQEKPIFAVEAETRLQESTVSSQHQPVDSAPFVGRMVELRQLQSCLGKALRGARQVVFITGEAGIGKTTLIETFLAGIGEQAASNSEQRTPAPNQLTPDARSSLPVPWIARGQCMAHYGVSEAYLPVLDAMNKLCREPGHGRLIALLNQQAPLWLMQMPALLSPHYRSRLQREVRGATQERMLREIAEVLEALTVEVPLVLVLEDLQWSDYATIDFLTLLATRQGPARLLILASYRPEELSPNVHPLKNMLHELHTHGRAHHLPVSLLAPEAVAQYLYERFPQHAFSASLASALYYRTEGNPFFLTSLIEHLVTRGVLSFHASQWVLTSSLDDLQLESPANIQDLIEHQIARLTEQEGHTLKVASVAGANFSTAAIAAGLQAPIEVVEECCEQLARRYQFLRAQGAEEWPDGTIAARYQFIHALYQQAWYARVTAARQVQLHQRIGERKEQGYSDHAAEIATELAVHFEHGRDARRAIHYRRQAANNAIRRFGYREAIHHLSKGLTFVAHLCDPQERAQQEIALQNALGAAYIATQGYASPAVERAYERAYSLCQQGELSAEQAPALRGLWGFNLSRMRLHMARTLAEQLLRVAQQVQSQALLLEAERELGQTCYFLGALPEARQYLEQSVARYDPKQHANHAFVYGQDPKVACLAQNARALCLLGRPDRARRQGQEALIFAQETAHPYSTALASYHVAVAAHEIGDWRQAQELAEATLALATEQGFPYWQFSALVLRGWALVQQGRLTGGIEQMQEGLAKYNATGAVLNHSYFLTLLAKAYGVAGRATEGLALLTQALTSAQESGGNFYQAEMLRLRGELLSTHEEEAEACFRQAIALARQQDAKLLELRATVSLVRLSQRQGKPRAAFSALSALYSWFTEGFDTRDLQEAKTILCAS